MDKVKVVSVGSYGLDLTGGLVLHSDHEQDCRENHYLSFSDLSINDFHDLEFDLTNDRFFRRVPGYGIELIPIHGHPVRVPGYGDNNGYYSSNLELVISDDKRYIKIYDISECQDY